MSPAALVAYLLLLGGACLQTLPGAAAWAADIKGQADTPYGQFRWAADETAESVAVFFNDKRIADYSLPFDAGVDGQFMLDDKLVVLFWMKGGTVCLNNYVLFRIDRRLRIDVSEPFGCGRADVRVEGSALLISVPGACHGSDSQEWLDTCAEELRSTYEFRNGKLREVTSGELKTPRPPRGEEGEQ
jgi:hypothetical protein